MTRLFTLLFAPRAADRDLVRLRWGLLLTILAFALPACVTTEYVLLIPPRVAGAEFVGTETCADCHDDIVARFAGATHASLTSDTVGAAGALGCEACHGPGSAHAEDGGESRSIVNPGRRPEVCLQCHVNESARFRLPHSHPVASGGVSCIDCHNPHEGRHGSDFGAMFALGAETAACTECHAEQAGPFAFPHEAMRDGCTVCHEPHGSINDKMLLSRTSSLCLSCHFEEPTPSGQLRIGRIDHQFFVTQGTCWTAGCHEAVHGSHVNSHLRY